MARAGNADRPKTEGAPTAACRRDIPAGSREILGSLLEHFHVRERKRPCDVSQEGGSLCSRLDEGEMQIRPSDRDRYPGKAGARTDVDNLCGISD
jgi:hypothetical protein